jgi:hypothetical protein
MENLTKEDFLFFKKELLTEINKLFTNEKMSEREGTDDFLWLRSKAVRRLMEISPSSLQNLRISGKVRYKKIMGSYYYSKEDLLKLFS